MSKRKYKEGLPITSLHEFAICLAKDKFIYCRHKIYHQGWATSWTFRYVASAISNGHVKRAIRIKEIKID